MGNIRQEMLLFFYFILAGGNETVLYCNESCKQWKRTFSKANFEFGTSENTTFYVYVYDLTPPLWIRISFSQHPKLNLLQFFVTFSV